MFPGATAQSISDSSAYVQADGKILVGESAYTQEGLFSVARYNANGTLDASFGTGGVASTSFGKNNLVSAVGPGPNGSVIVAGGVFSLDFARFTGDGAPVQPPSETPFGRSPAPVPGRIEAENFDNGGEGVGYHTVNPQNYSGNLYRTSGVTVENAVGGGYNVGFLHAGEYLKYTVNVASAGTYDFSARLAEAGAGALFHVEVDGVNVTGGLAVPDTGGYQSYQTVTRAGVNLSAGQHVVKVVFDANNAYGFAGNFDYFQFSSPGGPNAGVGTISGAVYNDSSNTNGQRDPGDPGIAGRQVYLDIPGIGSYQAGDPTTTTDANGFYQFTGLAPTNYLVRLVPMQGTAIDDPVYGGKHFVQLGVTPSATSRDFGVIAVGGNNGASLAQPDGKLIVALNHNFTLQGSGREIGLERFNADGTVDTTFGAAGFLHLGVALVGGVTGLAFRPDGNLIAVASENFSSDFAYVFTPGGTLVNGVQISSTHAPSRVTVQADNKVVIGVSDYQGPHRYIVRLNPDLSVDSTFGGGEVLIPGVDNLILTDLIVYANGNIQATYSDGFIPYAKTVSPNGTVS